MKLIHHTLIVTGILTVLTSPVSFSGDIEAGKSKSATCAACHGQNGISSNPEWPNLAGQQEKYLINQLKAFKNGDRKSQLMAPQATNLSDEDIENISAYFNSLK